MAKRGSLFQTIIEIQKGSLLDICGMYAAGKTAKIKHTAQSKGVFLFQGLLSGGVSMSQCPRTVAITLLMT